MEFSAEPITVGIKEAAAMTGLSRSRIYELLSDPDSKLSAVKIGKRRLVRVDSIREMVGAGAVAQAAR